MVGVTWPIIWSDAIVPVCVVSKGKSNSVAFWTFSVNFIGVYGGNFGLTQFIYAFVVKFCVFRGRSWWVLAKLLGPLCSASAVQSALSAASSWAPGESSCWWVVTIQHHHPWAHAWFLIKTSDKRFHNNFFCKFITKLIFSMCYFDIMFRMAT